MKAVFDLHNRHEIDWEVATAFQWRLRERFFVDNANIADRAVQLELLETLGIPRVPIVRALDDGSALAMLWEDHTERERLCVRGSPTYVFDDGRTMFYGNIDDRVLDATVCAYVAGNRSSGSDC